MRKPRLLFGVLHPGSTLPFLLLPHNPEGGGDGGGGGSGGGTGSGGSPPPNPASQPPALNAHGFPDNTAPDQMSGEHQVAYWKWRSRQNEEKGKEALAWRQANENKVSDYDRLVAASKTDQEKAIEAARAEAEAKGRATLVPQLVAAEFLAAAKGALTREQVTELLAPLDASKFLAQDGSVDAAKVSDWVGKFAPIAGAGGGGNNGGGGQNGGAGGGGKRWPGTNGQGSRGGNAQAPSVQAGRDLYAQLKGKQSTP